MHKTNISWTQQASNPIRSKNLETGKLGWFCTKTSDGCKNCYAETLNTGRFGNGLAYNHENRKKQEFVLVEKEFVEWRNRKKPTKIFVSDMTDLFHEDIPFEMILRVFYAMATADQHTYQVLTKRPERAIAFFKWWEDDCLARLADMICYYRPPLKNVWFGVSVENQAQADRRIPLLLQIPAEVRFLSCEPLLDEIDIEPYLNREWSNDDAEPNPKVPSVDWVICGGESGKNYRAMDLGWARKLRLQCENNGVAFFFKQESGIRPGTNPLLDGIEYHEYPK